MLPFVSATSAVEADVAGGQNVVAVPPSSRFKPPVGRITEAWIKPRAYTLWGNSGGLLSESQKRGLRYEEKVQEELTRRLPGYLPGPHVHFKDYLGYRTCIPDGILRRDWGVYVFEVKVQHMAEAWWQLAKLYKPVLQEHYGRDVQLSLIEVTRSYDPSAPFPCAHTLIESLDDWLTQPRDFGVWLCRV